MHPIGGGQPVHPWAWWAWALCVAAAVSLGTNPLLGGLVAFAVTTVVLLRRTDDPWARSVGAYFALAGFVIGVRLLFQVLVGAGTGATVLVRLPGIPLPEWAAGIRLGGPITAEALAYTFYDSLRLGIMLLCLGAANALANPKRTLKAVPAALYEASVAVVIALSVAPQLVESTQRVRKAQRLRGGSHHGWSAVVSVIIPVLADAIDRSLALAAGMESRGFGRTHDRRRASPWIDLALIASMMVVSLGGFLVLAAPDARPWALGCLVAGAVGVVGGLRLTGRRLCVTRYRPDPWTPRDTLIVAGGVLAVATAAVLTDRSRPSLFALMNPATDPLVWPTLHPAMLLILAGALAPLALSRAPEPARRPR